MDEGGELGVDGESAKGDGGEARGGEGCVYR